MILGIDASNVRAGGGITHLSNVLTAVDPADYGFSHVIVWARGQTLEKLPDAPWLEKVSVAALDQALPIRLLWQWFRLPGLLRERCDLVFSPGGNAPAGVGPLVTMSRNMLPFEWDELSRYGLSAMTLRLLLLRFGQARTFRRADTLIFLTEYAARVVGEVIGRSGATAIVPHGVSERFRAEPRPQRARSELSMESPLRLLYVSIVDLYKHQWQVAEAVARLRERGVPVRIDFVGPSFPAALTRFEAALAALDPERSFLSYRGPLPYEKLHELREEAEVFVFASSCENMPNILLEAMASGFPIASAERGPMPEILGDGGVYFDPEDPGSIEVALEQLVESAELREQCAKRAFERAQAFSWDRCARETFAVLRETAGADRADPAG